MSVRLVWATPDADKHIGYIARVSNPDNQNNPSIDGLLRYMLREGHVSPFEMASACLEITTTRDIARQILRHRSFSFQEFSQRYQSADALPASDLREARMQDRTNRQSSTICDNPQLAAWWVDAQDIVRRITLGHYESALRSGIAKEVARAILPEGLTTSRMYMSGTLRSWLHYLNQRLHASTQFEHRLIAQQVLLAVHTCAPITIDAFFAAEVKLYRSASPQQPELFDDGRA